MVFQLPYSAPLNFSIDLLQNSENAIKRLNNSLHQLETSPVLDSQEDFPVERFYQEFEEAMDENFNTPQAVAVFFDFVKEVNSFLAKYNGVSSANKEKILNVFKQIGEDILGIVNLQKRKSFDDKLLDDLMKIIIDIRSQMRAEKRFDIADKIRDELKKLNIELEDKKGITTYKFNK